MKRIFNTLLRIPVCTGREKFSELILSKFLSEELDDVYVVYTDMISSMKEEAKLLQILPFRRERFENLHSGKHREIHHTATFDPSPEIVMENLVPNYAKGLIYGTMVEAFASEQHARMMAMIPRQRALRI